MGRGPVVASTNTERRIHVAIDFDGTITVDDVSDELFKTYGQFEPIHTQLLDGEMSVAEYYRRSLEMVNDALTVEELRKFALERAPDPGFKDLVDLCLENNIDVYVVSDGFDSYIEPVLENAQVGPLPVFSNRLEWVDGGWQLTFPGASESCSCFCASCKRNVVLGRLQENDILVYVGDGLSDTCAARHADIIFAKHKLAAWCNEERIPHHTFKTLSEVRRVLASRLATGDLSPRRQAVLARQSSLSAE